LRKNKLDKSSQRKNSIALFFSYFLVLNQKFQFHSILQFDKIKYGFQFKSNKGTMCQ